MIKLGAKTLVVPGNLPIGCVPKYLLIFKSDNKEDYEPETGCLRWMNEFSEYHNKLLMEELEKLRKLHPSVTIIYADYYGAAMEVFVSPERFGEFRCFVFCWYNEVFRLLHTRNLYLGNSLTHNSMWHHAVHFYVLEKEQNIFSFLLFVASSLFSLHVISYQNYH